MQPALDTVASWARDWKVQASASKCCFTTFTLDPKECGGKVVPTLKFSGEPLRYDPNPTFLGITFDDQLTFSSHISSLKDRMAKRRQCLQALAGKTYGAHRRTLRTAYITYIRSVFEYGAAVYFTHASPALRVKIETEQNRCARIITGCILPTNTAALLAEADLPALTVRAKELAATEASRIARLPAEDRAKQLLERDPRPRLKYRAHEAWKRACAQAAEEGRPEPALPDEDALLPHKPCLRRVGQWTLREAGVSGCPAEPFLRVSPEPPWSAHQGSVTFIVDLPTTTRRTDPPDKRREAAERALAALPAPDCSIWSDGSAAGGTSNGGGGAAIILHRENDRRIECLAAAGTHCSSTRAELVAVREALKSLASLPADSLDAIKEIRLCTDSRACLQTLQRGQAAQQEELPASIWASLHDLTCSGKHVTLQWVPGHAGIPGNEDADRLANRAAAELSQAAVPLDMAGARAAIRHRSAEWTAARAKAHPHLPPTPGHEDLTRWEQVTLSQLRVGRSVLTRKTLHEIGLATNPDCLNCEEEDSVAHLLTECPAYARMRSRLWGGPLPSLGHVLGGSATLIFEYLRRVGRVDPPVDAATAVAAPAATA
ncbi:uncharacterized protein LOC122384061 [Amphibalanus amphitrite]|uniref:uncharacterized protein LOC122384061 n=1 Tax=Amphibalanus amphitrite TaxID=1232801 RepID=UPI001C90D747|nr:uncharacterized protein LOC122384061 [Amphibalanus amphitrite]